MKIFKQLLLLSLVTSVVACSATTDPAEIYKNQTAAEIFRGGEVALAKGEDNEAIQHFEGLDALYPFSANAEQAQLDLMYAYYKNDDNASASATADRFIRLYPRSAHLDYAYYVKGLADFDQDRGWFLRIFPSNLSERAFGTMRQSYDDFDSLVRLFPNSVYAPDARQRMIYLRNLFAEHELFIAKYYLQRQAYVAAANRANYIVQHYNGTTSVQPALGIMVQSYRALDLQPLANQALQVLQLNYPNGVVLRGLK